MKIASRALTIVALCAASLDCGAGSAYAAAFCVELTASEFNHRSNRRGDDNACAGDKNSNIEETARERARDNASNAVARQCLNNVTPQILRQACTRVNLIPNTAPDAGWANFPPAAKFSANKVKYIGHRSRGDGSNHGLCTVANDVSFRTRSVIDGNCDHEVGLLPHRNFAIARARARCAVVCSTP